MVSDWKRLWWR